MVAANGALAAGRLALVFPGGGAQYVGMGRDVYETYPASQYVFAQADAILGRALSRLCFDGPETELMDASNAQPAMLTATVAILAALQERLRHRLEPAFVAGHSTGEYTALAAAGALDFPVALRLICERGRLMQEAGDRRSGTMAAVLGLEAATLQAICTKVGNVWVANDNAPGQIVLSGGNAELERALQLSMAQGAKRVIPLAVNIASHCPLMSSAAVSFAKVVEQMPLHGAAVPVIANASAAAISEAEDIRQELVRQITSPVRWVESVRYMIAQGVRTFWEIGPKNVLSALIRRIDSTVITLSINSVADIQALEVGE
ncbi:MAG: ACP S-malonyltransferase [Chloroflexi bacterium]|nr:ACP S-malonyltransferase [Chloroflexota bacterium]